MELEHIRWRLDAAEGVGVVTLDRPKALNALTRQTLGELSELLRRVEVDRGVRALVVTGAGRAFVAGADIAELAALPPVEAREVSALGHRAFAQLEALAIPTIAAVNGFALGGGLELALACDLVYAAEGARLGLPEVTLGLIPGFGGTQRLARRVGLMRAKELILTGELIEARRARELGLVLEVLPPEELMPHVLGRARAIAARGPLATAAAKRVVERGAPLDLATACALEAEAFALLFATDDAREGTKAFLEKRPPAFTGR